MLLDWFTVIAQVVNFLILVWLLKKLLYKPILDAIDAREKHIADQLAEAEASKAAAAAEQESFSRRVAELDRDRAALMRQATEEAGARRVELLAAARKEFEETRERWESSLASDKEQLTREISAKARQELLAIVRKVLLDLADAELEDRIIAAFIRKLGALAENERKRLSSAFRAASGPVVMKTNFALTSDQQRAADEAVRKVLETEAPLHFEIWDELICGVELLVSSRKISWNISDYLITLEESIDELLYSRRKSGMAGEGADAAGAAPEEGSGGIEDEE